MGRQATQGGWPSNEGEVMSVLIHCDNPTCDKTTQEDHVVAGWIKVEHLSATMMSAAPERHYCSVQCEHAHTYILSHADAGK